MSESGALTGRNISLAVGVALLVTTWWLHPVAPPWAEHLMVLVAGLFLGGAGASWIRVPEAAEQALRLSEERFRALIENASDGITVLDATGKRIYTSPSASRILGYSPEELVGHTIQGELHPDDVDLMRDVQTRLLASRGESVEAQYRLRHKDGTWRWMEASGRNLLDNPSVSGLVANYRDITDRKQAEEAHRASEERFRALVENAPDGVGLLDAQGLFLPSGGSYRAILGYAEEELNGRSFRDIAHPDDIGGAEAIFTRVGSEPGGIGYFVLRARHLDGSWRWVEGVAKNLLANPAVAAIVVNYRDVTERHEAEEDRERRGRILEAVAFGAARLLAPGDWRTRADEVLARLGDAAEVARVHIVENTRELDGAIRGRLLHVWTAPGVTSLTDMPELKDGLRWESAGWGDWMEEMLEGRPVVGLVSARPPQQRALLAIMDAKAFASVPIMVRGEWWGLLGIQETRYERVWSALDIEAQRAAAAALGAAIERERADQALRESEERFKRLAEATSEGIALTEDSLVLDANDQLATMLGYGLTDLIGRPVQDLVAPEAWDTVRARREDGAQEYRHLARRIDGSVFPVEIRARSTHYRGRTVRVTAVRDVSAQVEAAQRQAQLQGAIRKAALEWRLTFDAIESPVLVVTPSGRIARMNRATQALCGRGFDEIADLSVTDLGAREPWVTFSNLVSRVVGTRSSQSTQARDESSGRTWEVAATLLTGGDQVILVASDVTRTIQLQESLRRSETMSAMGSLVAGVAHEVRNPLFSISANLDAFEAEVGQRPGVGEVFTVLRTEVERLSALMQDLLEYGRPHSLEVERVVLADVVGRAVASTHALALDRRVDVVNAVPDNIVLPMDKRRIEQVFQNLIVNSIQHLKGGGTVRVDAGMTHEGGYPWVSSSVEDTGPGFRDEDLAHVFEPFFTRRHGGTGLGLSIVARIVDDHGGRIQARNRPQGGAAITVRLPRGDV